MKLHEISKNVIDIGCHEIIFKLMNETNYIPSSKVIDHMLHDNNTHKNAINSYLYLNSRKMSAEIFNKIGVNHKNSYKILLSEWL